jgi:hypothetical protein
MHVRFALVVRGGALRGAEPRQPGAAAPDRASATAASSSSSKIPIFDFGEVRVRQEMPMPDNTLPMMTGFGQFGPIEMDGMFTVVKVREGIAPGDYRDPGWFKHPPGTVAYEYAGEVPEARRQKRTAVEQQPPALRAVKPKSTKH